MLHSDPHIKITNEVHYDYVSTSGLSKVGHPPENRTPTSIAAGIKAPNTARKPMPIVFITACPFAQSADASSSIIKPLLTNTSVIHIELANHFAAAGLGINRDAAHALNGEVCDRIGRINRHWRPEIICVDIARASICCLYANPIRHLTYSFFQESSAVCFSVTSNLISA